MRILHQKTETQAVAICSMNDVNAQRYCTLTNPVHRHGRMRILSALLVYIHVGHVIVMKFHFVWVQGSGGDRVVIFFVHK